MTCSATRGQQPHGGRCHYILMSTILFFSQLKASVVIFIFCFTIERPLGTHERVCIIVDCRLGPCTSGTEDGTSIGPKRNTSAQAMHPALAYRLKGGAYREKVIVWDIITAQKGKNQNCLNWY